MGSANLELVRRAFDAFERRDARVLAEVCSEDIVFEPVTARLAADGRPYVGHAGLRQYLADVARVWQELRPEPTECREVDDELVVCTGRVYAWGVGRVVDTPAGWLWRVRDGRIVHGRVYETARAALQAAEAERAA
ncbi:MAG: nuclear transport factor 2 family protein [Solirubrobacterales bacterium]|nr:nuclear transport factor 2 family protein [Solirubrobacterales bacterium]